jgi:hypothetical protein
MQVSKLEVKEVTHESNLVLTHLGWPLEGLACVFNVTSKLYAQRSALIHIHPERTGGYS